MIWWLLSAAWAVCAVEAGGMLKTSAPLELKSQDRAKELRKLLVELGVAGGRISAAGFGRVLTLKIPACRGSNPRRLIYFL